LAFTLIETALAMVVISTGVLAIMAAQQAFHLKNAWSTHASTATWLANEIRELTLDLPRHDPVTGTAYWGPEGNEVSFVDYDDLDDFDGNDNGFIFSAADATGPINARREIIPNMNGWSQTVTVFNVDPFDIDGDAVTNGSTEMLEVQVIVHYQPPNADEPIEMTRVRWIAPQ
jgi:hypothetical protein